MSGGCTVCGRVMGQHLEAQIALGRGSENGPWAEPKACLRMGTLDALKA